jgi:hypothetical protein
MNDAFGGKVVQSTKRQIHSEPRGIVLVTEFIRNGNRKVGTAGSQHSIKIRKVDANESAIPKARQLLLRHSAKVSEHTDNKRKFPARGFTTRLESDANALLP